MTPLYRWLAGHLPRSLVVPAWVILIALALAVVIVSLGGGSPEIVYLDVKAQ